MDKMINLETFANGALAERMNQGLKEVLENIADKNTDSKPKRKLTLDMTFSTDEERELTEVTITAKAKLAPRSAIATKIIIDKDLNGEVLGTEFKKQVKGQTYMKVDNETGEVFMGGTDEAPKEVVSESNENELAGLQIVK
ncbi:replication terminator protein [Clostridium sp. UBA1353]|uniref:replication terminator protein n=1 Tax=Clostridium sp. UBA1353 TaxID=1946347 RepID=UPI003217EB58